MPTGGEYRAMAAELEELATSLSQLTVSLVDAWGDDVVSVATRLGLTIARTVEAADANAATSAATMEAMAGECLTRAVVCDEYATAMGRHRADVAAYEDELRAAATDPSARVRPRPTPPTAPPWAEL